MTIHPQRRPLTPYELTGRLNSLSLSVQDFTALISHDTHSVRRWLDGHKPIPRWVGAFLDLAAENRDLEYSLREAERKRTELLQRNRTLFTG